MINILIDSSNKIISYYGTDIKLKTVDDLPSSPQEKAGINHIAYYNAEKNCIEYREEERELSEQEKLLKRLSEVETGQLSVMEAIAEIHEQGGGV